LLPIPEPISRQRVFFILYEEELLESFRIGETVICWLAAATNLLIIKGKC
jgi:hypothetical protein